MGVDQANGVVNYCRRPPQRPFLQRIQYAIWDPEERKFLGRTPKRWGVIGLIYLVMYICIIIFFSICMCGLLASVDEHIPYFTLADSIIGNNPGMGHRPVVFEEGALIWYRLDNETSYKKYTDNLDEFLAPYKNKSLLINKGENQVDCQQKSPHAGEVCAFDTSLLGPCTSEKDYGYADGTPCIIIKLNKPFSRADTTVLTYPPRCIHFACMLLVMGIFNLSLLKYLLDLVRVWPTRPSQVSFISSTWPKHLTVSFHIHIYDWQPQFYDDPGDLPSNMPPDILNYINTTKTPQERRQVWLSCKGERPADTESLGPLRYWPYPGLPENYFPYNNTPGYLSPLVAVQLLNPIRGQIINIRCRAWARNIVFTESLKERMGSTHLEIMVD